MHEHLPQKPQEERQQNTIDSRETNPQEAASPQSIPAHFSNPQLTPSRIMALQRTMGNQYVSGLIQRTLSSRAKRAFETATSQNSAYEAAKKRTDENTTEKEQDEVSKVRGAFSRMKKSEDKEKKLKDFIRAYLLSEFSMRIQQLPTKYPDLKKKDMDTKRKAYLSKAKEKRDMYAGLVGLGVEAPETRAFLKEQGFESGLPVSEKEVSEKADGPKIDVRSTFIGGKILGKRVRAHLFIVYTSAEGKQLYFRGGPSISDEVEVDWGDYTPDTVDYDPSAPSVTVLKGPEASTKIDGLIEAAKAINGMGVKYTAGGMFESGENCNTAAWTMLTRAGIPANHPGKGFPGWGHPVGSLSKKDMPDPENIPEKGQPYVVVTPEDEKFTVWGDREKLEVADELPGRTKIEYLDMVGNLARIRYQGLKIGFMRLGDIEPTDKAVDLLKGRLFMLATNVTPFKVGTQAQDVMGVQLKSGDEVEVVDKDFDKDTADDLDLVRIKFLDFGEYMLGEVNAMDLISLG